MDTAGFEEQLTALSSGEQKQEWKWKVRCFGL